MDSLTQVALGGAVAYAVLGSKVGRKAALWGAALGTLPDLDVLIPYAGDVEAFTYHRGFSHSIFMHLLISPLIVWLILKIHKTTVQYKTRWFWLVFLVLSSHAILDAFTVYGTQLLWPFTEYPFGVSNLFIIDPVYTIPLLVGLVYALKPNPSPEQRYRATKINVFVLGLSSVYVVWTLGAKQFIDYKIKGALAANHIVAGPYMSTPAPFNTLLWRAIAVSDGKYYEIYASVFDEVDEVSITPYVSQTQLVGGMSDSWALNRLQWFTKGLYSIRQTNDKVVFSDLRMGVECAYVFNFEVATISDEGIVMSDFTRFSQRPNLDSVGKIWDRIWDPAVSLEPSEETCKPPI